MRKYPWGSVCRYLGAVEKRLEVRVKATHFIADHCVAHPSNCRECYFKKLTAALSCIGIWLQNKRIKSQISRNKTKLLINYDLYVFSNPMGRKNSCRALTTRALSLHGWDFGRLSGSVYKNKNKYYRHVTYLLHKKSWNKNNAPCDSSFQNSEMRCAGGHKTVPEGNNVKYL